MCIRDSVCPEGTIVDAACFGIAEDETCTHFGVPGVCRSDVCVDDRPCSDEKIEHIDACAADCASCDGAALELLLGSCTMQNYNMMWVAQTYDVVCPTGGR